MKEFLKARICGTVRWCARFCVPTLVFLVASALDAILQIETRTQIEEFFSNPLLDGLNILARVVKAGLLWGSLAYFLDHGETPKSSAWRDQSNPDLFKIPFVIWFSPEYRRKFPGVVMSIEKMAKEPFRLDHAKVVLRLLARVET